MAGGPHFSPYLVSITEMVHGEGPGVPKRTIPSNSGTRGDNVGGRERESRKKIDPALGDRGDSRRSHWTAEYYRQSGLFQRLVYSSGQNGHSGCSGWSPVGEVYWCRC